MSGPIRVVVEVMFWGSLVALPLAVLAAVRSRSPAADADDRRLTKVEQRWLIGLGTLLGLEVVSAALLCLTIFLGFIGWPWLWLSWSMLRGVDGLRRGVLHSPTLLLVQCIGVAVVLLVIVASILYGGEARTTGQMNWLLVGPPLVILHLRVAGIAHRVGSYSGARPHVSRVLL